MEQIRFWQALALRSAFDDQPFFGHNETPHAVTLESLNHVTIDLDEVRR
jgi:hypothetical protein